MLDNIDCCILPSSAYFLRTNYLGSVNIFVSLWFDSLDELTFVLRTGSTGKTRGVLDSFEVLQKFLQFTETVEKA